MKKLIAAFVLTSIVWVAAYARLAHQRDDYRNRIIEAEDAIRTLPDSKVYFLGQERNGDLIVVCVNGGDPTLRGSEDTLRLNISCGK